MFSSSFFNFVVVRHVSSNFVNALVMEPCSEPICVNKCIEQHKEYINLIKENCENIFVYELEQDDSYPDCMFIEDTSVVIGNTVVITQPGDESRRGETKMLEKFWEEMKNNAKSCISNIITMNNYPLKEKTQSPLLDGGDVLFVPLSSYYKDNKDSNKWVGDLYVGISSRTNEEGAEVLRQSFKHLNIDVHSIQLFSKNKSNDNHQNVLHLKSMTTALSPSKLLIGNDSVSLYIKEQMDEIAERKYGKGEYKWIEIPEPLAVNVLVINGVIFFPYGCEKSKEIIEKEIKEDEFITDRKSVV